MSSLKPNHLRATQAMLGIIAVSLVSCISAYSKYLQYKLIIDIQQGDIYTNDSLMNNDLRENIILFVYIAVYILSIVFFIRWFRRAYYNLEQKEPFLSFTNATASWGWFVPIFNLYKPYQIMKEMFVKTDTLFEDNNILRVKSLNTRILGLWWFFWLTIMLLDRVTYKVAQYNDTVEHILLSTKISIINNLCLLPLAIVTILLIRNYSQNETLLARVPDKESLVTVANHSDEDGVD